MNCLTVPAISCSFMSASNVTGMMNSLLFFFQNDGDLPGCVPLTYCLISRKSQYIAVSDVSGFTVGEVFYPTPDQGSCDVDIFITGKQHSQVEPVTGKENGCLIMGWDQKTE